MPERQAAAPRSSGGAPLTSHLRPGFLATFTLVGLVTIVALALVLSRVIGGQIRDDQLDKARDTAQLLAVSAVGPALLTGIERGRVPTRELDRVIVAAKPSAGFDTLVASQPSGRIVYANDHRLIGRTPALSPLAVRALRGASVLQVQKAPVGVTDLSHGAQIDVAVPLHKAGDQRAVAVVETRTPYAPVASVIASRTRNLKLIMFGVGLLLFAALWPRLLAASRALKEQSDPARSAC